MDLPLIVSPIIPPEGGLSAAVGPASWADQDWHHYEGALATFADIEVAHQFAKAVNEHGSLRIIADLAQAVVVLKGAARDEAITALATALESHKT